MTRTIQLNIDKCADCPNVHTERQYTEDSFEYLQRYKCTLINKTIEQYVEVFDKVSIPEWCPLEIK